MNTFAVYNCIIIDDPNHICISCLMPAGWKFDKMIEKNIGYILHGLKWDVQFDILEERKENTLMIEIKK